MLQLVPPQLGFLELHLTVEELVQDLHAIDRVEGLFLTALRLVPLSMRQKFGLFGLSDCGIQLFLGVHHQFLCIQILGFEINDQLPPLAEKLGLDVSIHDIYHDLSVHFEYLCIIRSDRSSVLVGLVLDYLFNAEDFSLTQHAKSLGPALLVDVEGHLAIHYHHYLVGDALLVGQNGVSGVFLALRGQQYLFEEGPLDLAEDPDAFEEIDPVPEFLVLEVAGEGVVEDVHGQLQEVAHRGRPRALELLLAVLHLLAEVLAHLQPPVKLGLLPLLLVLGPGEEQHCPLEDVVKSAFILVLKDDLPELHLDQSNTGEDDLKVEVSLFLVDEIEERDLQQEVLFFNLLLGCQLGLSVEELLTHLLDVLYFHYKVHPGMNRLHQACWRVYYLITIRCSLVTSDQQSSIYNPKNVGQPLRPDHASHLLQVIRTAVDHPDPPGRALIALLHLHLLLLHQDLARPHRHGLPRRNAHCLHHRLHRHRQPPQGLYRNAGGAQVAPQAQGGHQAVRLIRAESGWQGGQDRAGDRVHQQGRAQLLHPPRLLQDQEDEQLLSQRQRRLSPQALPAQEGGTEGERGGDPDSARVIIVTQILRVSLIGEVDDVPLADDEVELASALPLGEEHQQKREEAHAEEEPVEQHEMLYKVDLSSDVLEGCAAQEGGYTQALGRPDCCRITAARKQMPQMREKRQIWVAESSMFSLFLRRMQSMNALKFIEKARTLVIMMQPIRMKEMYWVISWKVGPRFRCRSSCTMLTRRVIGSAEFFLPRIVLRMVRTILEMEQAASTKENLWNSLPLNVSETVCLRSSSRISRQCRKLSSWTFFKVSSSFTCSVQSCSNLPICLSRSSFFPSPPFTKLSNLDTVLTFPLVLSISFLTLSRSSLICSISYLCFLICSMMKCISSSIFFLACRILNRSFWLMRLQSTQGNQMAPQADIRAIRQTPYSIISYMKILSYSYLVPIYYQVVFTFLQKKKRQTMLRRMPRMGILSAVKRWSTKGRRKMRQSGMTISHMAMSTVSTKYQQEWLILNLMISKRYIDSSESEQEKVTRKIILERVCLICFYIRYWVIIALPSQLVAAIVNTKLREGQRVPMVARYSRVSEMLMPELWLKFNRNNKQSLYVESNRQQQTAIICRTAEVLGWSSLHLISMWKGFDEAQGWEYVATQHSSNNTQVHLLRMYSATTETQITASQVYAFKIITITPPTVILSNKSIQKVSLKDKDVGKVKTEIVALERMRGCAGIIELFEVLLEDAKNSGWKAFFNNFMNKAKNNGRTVCFVLEYCPHSTLKDYIANHQMDQSQIVRVCLKIFESLLSLKQCEVLHRDFRSTNLMIASQGIKLIDFDCSFIKGYSTVDNLTFSFVAATTAPEVIQLIDLDDQAKREMPPQSMYELQQGCDLYSFGTIVFEMINRRQYDRRPVLDRQVSKELQALAFGLLQQNPRERLDHSQVRHSLQVLAQKNSLQYQLPRRKKTKRSMAVPHIQTDPTDSSKSLSNKPSLSDWSLQSASTKHITTSKDLSRHTTIHEYVSNHRTIND